MQRTLTQASSLLKLLMMSSLLLTGGCYRVPDKIEPQVSYSVADGHIKELPTSFPPLTAPEKQSSWGQEYQIGVAFAKELDLYRAITFFKRSEILLPIGNEKRLKELQYYIIYSYYLGKRYDEAVDAFHDSDLKAADSSFPAYHDLLVILYESYFAIGEEDKAEYILEITKHEYPETAKKLAISTALITGDMETIRDSEHHATISKPYELQKKSIPKAQALNIIPGAGYLYVGQKQSALTAALLNAAFIFATVKFFQNGNVPAGVIFASFEMGWYFGGIYGAGEAAKLYNERLYETRAHHALAKDHLYPVLQLRYGF